MEKQDKIIFKSRQNSALDGDEKQIRQAVIPQMEMALDSTPMLLSAIVGIDTPVRPMQLEEIEALGDPFTTQILLKGKTPMTLTELINEIEALDAPSYPIRKLFLIAEGGQIKLNQPEFSLNARLVYTWQKDNSTPPDLMLSTVPVANHNESLLQLISWSEKDGSFHFFERKRGFWGWAGNSFTAFDERARGKGPFDSHINGGLVMKELKFPWAHWHSMSNSIPRDAFDADSEFNTNPLFGIISSADKLEPIVKTGIRRWYKSRIKNDLNGTTLDNVETYTRQLFGSTTVNLISSGIEFHRIKNDSIALPGTFFYDLDGIEYAASKIDPFQAVIPPINIAFDGNMYDAIAREMQLRIVDNCSSGTPIKEGDTHFCFTVPERAFEDLEACKQLVQNKFISAKFMLCTLMVDFTNPIRSELRKALMAYAPDNININSDFALENAILSEIQKTEFQNRPEVIAFMEYWNESNLLIRVQNELKLFMESIQNQMQNEAYAKKLFQLAEFRKQRFRTRLLNEFCSTTSRTEHPVDKRTIDKNGIIN